MGVLLFLFWLGRRFDKTGENQSPAYGALTGLIAGLGFAVMETALYGSANFRIALVRAFTAAPLHGACGARIGLGAFNIKEEPFLALTRFLYAVVLHGMYNFMLISPGIPAVFPIITALVALFSSVEVIRSRNSIEKI
jgi:RsiW-degrading membrane proteinase PrsW (M82 family)